MDNLDNSGTQIAVHVPATPKLMLNPKMEVCSHCAASLIAMEIPVCDREAYIPMGQTDDGQFLFFSKVVGHSSMLFDRILAYECPFCNNIDVIPGMEKMWAEDQAYWESQRERDKGRLDDQGKPFCPFPLVSADCVL